LATARAVRRRGNRRTRRQILASGVVTVLAVLTGVMAGVGWLGNDDRGGPAVGPSPPISSTSPSPRESPSSDAERSATIPDQALLPELRGKVTHYLADPAEVPFLKPPRPCGADAYASDRDRIASRVAAAVLSQDTPSGPSPADVLEYIARYDEGSGGAEAYMNELRRDLDRCPGTIGARERGEYEWSRLGSDFAGDESLLLRIRARYKVDDSTTITGRYYLAVARVGNVVAVVGDFGWEGDAGPSARYAQDLGVRAAETARTVAAS
jgi:hypothetical protein